MEKTPQSSNPAKELTWSYAGFPLQSYDVVEEDCRRFCVQAFINNRWTDVTGDHLPLGDASDAARLHDDIAKGIIRCLANDLQAAQAKASADMAALTVNISQLLWHLDKCQLDDDGKEYRPNKVVCETVVADMAIKQALSALRGFVKVDR